MSQRNQSDVATGDAPSQQVMTPIFVDVSPEKASRRVGRLAEGFCDPFRAEAPTRVALLTGTQPQKRSLFGVGVSVTNYESIVAYAITQARTREHCIIDFAAAHVLVGGATSKAFRDRLNQFDALCPDGQPVRWSLNHFYGVKLTDRVYGPSCTLLLCEAAAREGISVYLYGASESTLALFRDALVARYPALKIAGAESPPFRPLTDEEDAAVIERINASGAGLVFVGIGSPKQENFAWAHRNSIRGVQLCVGAAFDFIAGTKRIAPAWMQRRGLEWVFRLVTEPRRLFLRYAITNSQFVYYFMKQRLGFRPYSVK